MAAKIEWTAIDYAATEELARVIDDSGLAYRVIAERMGGWVSHVRIGYIHNGEKSPVRLSEFLGICEVCNADPVQTLRDIIAEAQRIEARERLKTMPVESRPPTMPDDVVGRDGRDPVAEEEARKRALVMDKLHRGDMHLAAYEDPHKLDPDIDE